MRQKNRFVFKLRPNIFFISLVSWTVFGNVLLVYVLFTSIIIQIHK